MYDSNDLLNTPICETENNPVEEAELDEVDIMDTPIDGYLTEMPKVIEGVVPYGNFMKQWKKMTKHDIKAVQDYLTENPELHNVPIKDKRYKEASGIARKLRWNLKNNAASQTGDARIINAYISNLNQIFLLLCYPKSAQEDPTSVQIKMIRDTIKELKGE